MTIPSYLGILRDKGYKITPLRKQILDVFRAQNASLTAEKVCAIVRRRIPKAGLQSVYRNLADFTKIGITEEIFLERRKTAYALCNSVASHHHHAVCRQCGRAVEVKACELGALSGELGQSFTNIKRKTGFLIERHSLQLEGLCDDCQ